MQRLFYLAAGWLLAGSASAQQWQVAPEAPAPLAPGPVAIARVVDARFERASIALLNPEASQLPRPVAYADGLAPTLQHFFTRYAPGQPGAVPLLLRITAFDAAEARGAVAGFVGDLYAPQPDSSYRLVRHLLLATRQPELLPSKAVRAQNLGNLLLNVAAAGRDQLAWLPAGPAWPAAYVTTPQPHPAEQLPVLRPGTRLVPGYYHAITELWNNAPSEAGPPDLEVRDYPGTEWADEPDVKAYRRTADGRRVSAADVWGMSDGQHVYVKRSGGFYRLRQQDGSFVLRTHVRSSSTDLGTAAALVMAAGIIGTGSGLGAVPVPLGTGTQSPAGSSAPTLLRLHLLTGLFVPVAHHTLAELPTQLYLYRPRNAQGPAVRVGLAGEPLRELAAGDYLSFDVPAGRPVQLCQEPARAAAPCLALTPAVGVTSYVEYQPGQPQPFRPVPAKTGAAALDRLVR